MKFSDEIKETLQISKDVAMEVGHDYLSSFHFLIATLRTDNLARKTFDDLGWKFEDLIGVISQKNKVYTENPRLTVEFARTLKTSKYYAWINGKEKVNVEHFILTMIADKRSLAGNYLISLGMDYDRFKEYLLKKDNFKTKSIFERPGRKQLLIQTGLIKIISGLL